jgi:glycosyltransferase involved in cell wall biosynthesis
MAGNCVLASDTAAQRQLLNKYNGVGLLYKHNDATDLAIKIQQLLDDKEKICNCKINALEVTEKDLNWENEREKLYKIVQDVLKEKSINERFIETP